MLVLIVPYRCYFGSVPRAVCLSCMAFFWYRSGKWKTIRGSWGITQHRMVAFLPVFQDNLLAPFQRWKCPRISFLNIFLRLIVLKCFSIYSVASKKYTKQPRSLWSKVRGFFTCIRLPKACVSSGVTDRTNCAVASWEYSEKWVTDTYFNKK
jgi:hypothetical protein